MMTRLLMILSLLALLIVGVSPVFAQADHSANVDNESLPAGGTAPVVSPQSPMMASPQSPQGQILHRKRVAVVNFEVPYELRHAWGRDGEAAAVRMNTALTDMFTSALANTGAFDVIERAQIDKLLNEQRLDRAALLDPATAPRLGKILGVNMILGGRLTEFGISQGGGVGVATRLFSFGVHNSTARVTVDARLIDANTGKVLFTQTGVGENSEEGLRFIGIDFHRLAVATDFNSREWTESRIGRAARDAVNQIAANIAANYPIEAQVAAVLPDGSGILNIGHFAGIRVGDIFDLVQLSQVCDPATGSVIYEDRKPLGTLRVISVQDNGCKVILLGDPEGRQLHQNDVAILRKAADKKKH